MKNTKDDALDPGVKDEINFLFLKINLELFLILIGVEFDNFVPILVYKLMTELNYCIYNKGTIGSYF